MVLCRIRTQGGIQERELSFAGHCRPQFVDQAAPVAAQCPDEGSALQGEFEVDQAVEHVSGGALLPHIVHGGRVYVWPVYVRFHIIYCPVGVVFEVVQSCLIFCAEEDSVGKGRARALTCIVYLAGDLIVSLVGSRSCFCPFVPSPDVHLGKLPILILVPKVYAHVRAG